LISQFTHTLPDGKTKNLIMKVLYNKTNGDRGNGLLKSETELIENAFKNLRTEATEHTSGENWSRALYRDFNFKDPINPPKGKKSGLAEFCRQMKEHQAKLNK
jgi:hypothetical protein